MSRLGYPEHIPHFVLDGEHPNFFQIVTSRSERKYPIEPLTDLSFPEFLPLFLLQKKVYLIFAYDEWLILMG